MQLEWKHLRAVPVFLLVFFGVVVIDSWIRGPKAKQHLAKVEGELQSISDPESSKMKNAIDWFKTSGGSAGRILQTNLEPDEIQLYYRAKLEERHWFYYKQDLVLSRRRQIFCNGNNEAAVLVLPEVVTTKPYEYSLTISWNNTEGCN